MRRGMIYKLIFILMLITFCVMLIMPTVGEKRMKIDLLNTATEENISKIRKRFSESSYKVEQNENTLIVIGSGISLNDAVMNEVKTFPGIGKISFLKHWAEESFLARKINLGLDLQGGMHLVLKADYAKILDLKKKETKAKLVKEKKSADEINEALSEIALTENEKSAITQQALELIRNRIDKFGVSEPSIRPRGNEHIEIQLPGVSNPGAVKRLLKTTGRVLYQLVDDDLTKKAIAWLKKQEQSALPVDEVQLANLKNEMTEEIELPTETHQIMFLYERVKDSKKLVPSSPMVLENIIGLAGDDIKKAWIDKDEYGGFAVHFNTTAAGAIKFANVTAPKNKDRRMAIVIDDRIRSAPQINNQITGGRAQITGSFTEEEVKSLRGIINEGALPVSLEFMEERTVGPTLGEDAIKSGVNAILIGLGFIMIFMIIYYKMSGIIADVGLILNMVFLLALLSWMGFTLTLPGFAGFILTVGMAVDANVIIFERIKEEIRSGKSVRMSIVYGFDKAFWTIFDANLTTLIAAFILSQYGTGPIKGFAVTLFIGILSSMFVALYVTRFIYELISLNKNMKKLSI